MLKFATDIKHSLHFSFMKINKKIRSGDLKVDHYIEELEEALLVKENSAIENFIRSSNKVAKVFASDLALLAEGRIDECKLLNADKTDATVDRIMLMLKNSELFSQISKTAEALAPEVVNEATDLKIVIGDDENPFEKMQQRVKEQASGRK